MSFKDSLLGLVIIFIWGFNFVVIAWGVNDLPPLLMGAARFLMVAIVGSLFVRKPDIPWRWMALYAFVLCFGQFSFLFSALAYGMPAGLASIVLQSQALFTIVLSFVVLGEGIRKRQLWAIALSGIGLVIIAIAGGEANMTILGFFLTLAGALAWAAGNIVNRIITQRGHKANLGLVVWSSWVAFVPFLLSSIMFEGADAIEQGIMQFDGSTFAVVAYLAFGASILGYSLWSYLLSKYPAGQVAPLTLGVPVVGLLCASWFLGEHIDALQWLGIALVMLGLVVNSLGGLLSIIRNKKSML